MPSPGTSSMSATSEASLLAAQVEWKYIVIDEAQRMKDRQSPSWPRTWTASHRAPPAAHRRAPGACLLTENTWHACLHLSRRSAGECVAVLVSICVIALPVFFFFFLAGKHAQWCRLCRHCTNYGLLAAVSETPVSWRAHAAGTPLQNELRELWALLNLLLPEVRRSLAVQWPVHAV